MKVKSRNPLPVKYVFHSMEEHGILIHLKYINVVRGEMQVPGVEFIESLSPVTLDISTRILIGLNLYHK